MSDETLNTNGPVEKIQMDWTGFPSVSDPEADRFMGVVETDEFADDGAARQEALKFAAQSVAEGASLASVARWFGIPESDLAALFEERGVRPSSPDSGRDLGKAAEGSPPPALSTPGLSEYSPRTAIGSKRRPEQSSPMGFSDSVHMLRRRLLVVLVGLVVGVSAGWLTAPGKMGHAPTFQATQTLIYEPQGNQSYNIDQVALLATSGEVPSRVAARLRLDRGQVRSSVSAVANTEVGTISITGRSPQAATAESLSDTTADELVAEIDGAAQALYKSELARLTAQATSAEQRLAAVSSRDTVGQATARSDVDAAQRAVRQYQVPPKSQLRTLEKASADAVTPGGVQAPNSKRVRAFLLGVVGLLLGVAGAFALERLDSRIRSKTGAEEAFGAAVIAEVPPIHKASQGKLLTLTEPTSPFVEAYRGLRTYVALWAPEGALDDGHRVIVVTSPAPGEGKTTTVAHLAAMLAEIGRSVVVVSADLRRPRLHEYFGSQEGPGLTDRLAANTASPSFEGLDRPTAVRGIRLVHSGPPTANPAAMIEHAGDLVRFLRGLADFVLIDSPPLLVANDGAELARHADGVLLVARAGKTPVEAADHSAEILERLGIPVVGAVLVESEAASSASRYYSSRYYAEPDRIGRRRRSPAAPAASEDATAASGQ